MTRAVLTRTAVFGLVVATTALAQSARRLTTIETLRQFPGYFHLQPVLARGELVQNGPRTVLRTDEHEIRLLVTPGTQTPSGHVEMRGTFVDVGKLEPGDPRLAGYARADDDRWPRPGEELLVIVSGLSPLTPGAPLSMRTLALEPWRFDGQPVTLVGQFRGRNLFGDLPGAPRKSQYDFVLKSGDASVWVVGLRPRGKGFELDVDARIDTKQWLEVTGVARRTAGLVTIEASRMTATTEPTAATEREDVAAPLPSPPVEVVFSSPTADEIDVPASGSVRIQFSRNIKLETLKDHLFVSYVGGDPAAPPPAIEWRTTYDSAARAVEVRFAQPLAPSRTVKVELREGILGFDGAPVLPWSVTFRVGG